MIINLILQIDVFLNIFINIKLSYMFFLILSNISNLFKF